MNAEHPFAVLRNMALREKRYSRYLESIFGKDELASGRGSCCPKNSTQSQHAYRGISKHTVQRKAPKSQHACRSVSKKKIMPMTTNVVRRDKAHTFTRLHEKSLLQPKLPRLLSPNALRNISTMGPPFSLPHGTIK